MHLVRGAAALCALFLFFSSLKFLDLSDAVLLSNTMPIFIPFILYFWKGVPIQHRLWWGISLAFIGILVTMQPGLGVFQPASILALLSAIASGVGTVALRFAHFHESPTRTLFYYFFVTAIFALIVSLLHPVENWESLNSTSIGWLAAIGLGGLGWQICLTLATKYAPVRLTSIFLYTSVIFSMVLDLLIWQKPISIVVIIGFLLIACGAWLVAHMFPKEHL